MASRFVEVDEEFIEETQVRRKTHKKVLTTGLKFSNNGQRREEKMSNLKATKNQRSTKPSIILPLMYFQSFQNCPGRFATRAIL